MHDDPNNHFTIGLCIELAPQRENNTGYQVAEKPPPTPVHARLGGSALGRLGRPILDGTYHHPILTIHGIARHGIRLHRLRAHSLLPVSAFKNMSTDNRKGKRFSSSKSPAHVPDMRWRLPIYC